MKLIAEILTGSLFYVEIEEGATLQDLKVKIGNQENLPTNRLILMLDADNERYLLDNDEISLQDYGVQDGSHIYIFFHQPSDDKSSDTPPKSPSSDSTSSQDSASKESPATPTTPPPPVSSSSDSEEESK